MVLTHAENWGFYNFLQLYIFLNLAPFCRKLLKVEKIKDSIYKNY